MSTSHVGGVPEGQATVFRSEANDNIAHISQFWGPASQPPKTHFFRLRFTRASTTESESGPRPLMWAWDMSVCVQRDEQRCSEVKWTIGFDPYNVTHTSSFLGPVSQSPKTSLFRLRAPTTECESGPRPLVWAWDMSVVTQRDKQHCSEVKWTIGFDPYNVVHINSFWNEFVTSHVLFNFLFHL